MVQFLSINFFLGFLQFLLGFSKVPVFFVSLCMLPLRDSAQLSVFSPRRLGFDPGSVCVRFVVDRVALGQVCLLVFQFYPINITTAMLHIRLHVHVALPRRRNGRSLETFQKAMLFRKSGIVEQKIVFTFLSLMLVSTVVLFFVYRISVLLFRSQGNSVHTVTRLRTELFGVRIWEESRDSLLYQNMQTGCGVHPTSQSMGIEGAPSPRVKRSRPRLTNFIYCGS